MVVADCPRHVKIDPPSADSAGTELTCTAAGSPNTKFLWVEHHNNDSIHHGPTYTLESGDYNITCVAYDEPPPMPPGKPPCRDVDSWAYKRHNDTEFPHSVFDLTAPDQKAHAHPCHANYTISRQATGKYNKCIAVRKVATPLRELTCHMGSHSVTCYPAELTFPPLPQPKLVLDYATPEGCKAELT